VEVESLDILDVLLRPMFASFLREDQSLLTQPLRVRYSPKGIREFLGANRRNCGIYRYAANGAEMAPKMRGIFFNFFHNGAKNV